MTLAKYIGVTLKTFWLLLHKIRSAMGGAMPFTGLAIPLKWMRHFSVGNPKENGAGAVAIKPRWPVTLQLNGNGCPQFLKMQVTTDTKGDALLAFVKKSHRSSTIHSDAFSSYNALTGEYCCDMQKYEPKSDDTRLKWLHVMISNIKANIEGSYHDFDGTSRQRYLDELCYRFNRRQSRKPLFDHLLACSVWIPYRTIAELCI